MILPIMFLSVTLNTSAGADIKESQNIASLHNQITACDSILEVSALQHTRFQIIQTIIQKKLLEYMIIYYIYIVSIFECIYQCWAVTSYCNLVTVIILLLQ